MKIDHMELGKQVAAFKDVRGDYELIEDFLREILMLCKNRICPTAVVDARTKTIKSFAGKCVRKWGDVQDPVNEFTDLCGARAIVQLPSDVEWLVRFVRDHFDIDEPNSQDTRERLEAHEFGYRSVHLIVKLPPKKLPDGMKRLTKSTRDRIAGKRAEIQLRTIAQHVWADIGHDRLYKSAFQVPATYERQSAKIAAMLEQVDEAFTDLVAAVDSLSTNVETYKDEDETKDEIERLKAILQHDAKNAGLATELARRQLSLGQYAETIKTVASFQGAQTPDLQTCLGRAHCQANSSKPHSRAFQKGQKELRKVVEANANHIEALTRLAESCAWKDQMTEARDLFRRAFEQDPNDPRALGGYLRHYIAHARDVQLVGLLRPNLQAAIQRCQAQVDVRVNLPHALYQMAEFLLLMDPPGDDTKVNHAYEGLYALCRAISLTPDASPGPIDDALHRLTMLNVVKNQLPGLEWARRTLLICQAARSIPANGKFPLKRMSTEAAKHVHAPVLIIAGGCDAASKGQVKEYQKLLEHALSEFNGTVISGGTREGISGLVGRLCSKRNQAAKGCITSVGYLPRTMPSDGSAHRDERYDVLAISDGKEAFSPAEPLQSWIDILHARIHPQTVKLIGINGGRIAAFEYHLAAALRAQVAVVRESGRQADILMLHDDAPGNELIHFLPHDTETFKSFVHYPPTCGFEKEQIATLSLGVSRAYDDMMHQRRKEEWREYLNNNPELKGDFDRSSRHQAMNIPQMLARIGKQAVPVNGRDPVLYELTDAQIEELAEVEHGRWVVERTFAGWKFGKERDDEKKRRPQLISWDDIGLPDDEKEKDRNAVRQIPKLLAEIGYEIVDLPKD